MQYTKEIISACGREKALVRKNYSQIIHLFSLPICLEWTTKSTHLCSVHVFSSMNIELNKFSSSHLLFIFWMLDVVKYSYKPNTDLSFKI